MEHSEKKWSVVAGFYCCDVQVLFLFFFSVIISYNNSSLDWRDHYLHKLDEKTKLTAKPWTTILLDWKLDLTADLISQTWKLKQW